MIRHSKDSGVVFFDGVCGTCNAIVDFLLRRDRNHTLKFAPLQGTTAHRDLSAADIQDLQTLVFRDHNGQLYRRSAAIGRIFEELPWPWRIFSVIRFVPPAISDFFYNLFARNRYIMGGRRADCRLPTEEERERFLD